MSREIKFRAWSIKKSKYLDIDTLYCANGKVCGIVCDGVVYDADNTILEQDTGLKDKNGKKIYVGDILETCCGKAEVYFDDELLMYKIEVRHGGTMPLVSKKSKRHFDYEIIGTIHENPELLEKGNK